jgi:hypothetical protein
MEMGFFWVADTVEQRKFDIKYYPGKENLADYQNKHHVGAHLDLSYLSEANAHSRACGHFFMGWHADPTKPIKLNGAFFTLCAILRFVVASAAEAKLGALFLNCKQATIFQLTLEEMGHPQPPTPVHCDNSTAVSIANNTVK